jgi:hypothetical protein
MLRPRDKRAASSCFQENMAMKKHNTPPDISDLINLVNAMIAYWKAIAESNYKMMKPDSDLSEFEREWPKILDNFFLAKTVRTARLLRSFPTEGCDN